MFSKIVKMSKVFLTKVFVEDDFLKESDYAYVSLSVDQIDALLELMNKVSEDTSITSLTSNEKFNVTFLDKDYTTELKDQDEEKDPDAFYSQDDCTDIKYIKPINNISQHRKNCWFWAKVYAGFVYFEYTQKHSDELHQTGNILIDDLKKLRSFLKDSEEEQEEK